MEFYEKLFELRKKEGFSQEDLADKIYVSRQTVSKWETGQSTPEMDKLIELSKIFNISIDELVGKTKSENEENKESKKTDINLKKKHIFLKVLMILVIVYLVIFIYKYISLTIMNNIGNSFSEESYDIMLTHKSNDNLDGSIVINNFSFLKVKDKAIERSYNMIDIENPYHIVYVDLDKKERYEIAYVQEKEKYVLMGDTKSIGNEKQIEEYFEDYKNLNNFKLYAGVDKYTIGYKLKMALNPCVFVNIFNRKIIIYDPFNFKAVYEYNSDYLLSRTIIKNINTGYYYEDTISYDYVPDHFVNLEIVNPMESNEYEIIKKDQ